MSLLNNIGGLVGKTKSLSLGSTSQSLNQVRNATKRAAGSRTNKNDSAGRRLGPKAYEGHFVKPGQIIMRQRGTKIHPGENTDIGRDHTIFAIEPGYVRFYYDPFHPLRKYVGVALTADTTLPLPHFEPRMRRFGYEEIIDPVEAKKEEDHMSRKEYLQTPELEKSKSELEEHLNSKRSQFTEEIKTKLTLAETTDEAKLALIVERMLTIYQLNKIGQSIEEAQIQASFNYVHDLKLKLRKAEIDEATFNTKRDQYREIADVTDKKLSVDAQGSICEYLSPESLKLKQEEILKQLRTDFSGKIIKLEDKRSILDLIQTAGVFSKAEQSQLKSEFLPPVLPVSVPGTVKENFDPKKPGKDVTVVRIFDDKTKEVKVYGRTKQAYVPQD